MINNSHYLRATNQKEKQHKETEELLSIVHARLLERLDYINLKNIRHYLNLSYHQTLSSSVLKKQFPHAKNKEEAISLSYSPPKKTLSFDFHALPDHSIDLVYSVFMLEWITDIKTWLTEIKRVLTPNGLFIFATLGPGTLHELRKSWQQLDSYVHVNAFHDMHDLGDHLLQLKFQDPVMEREDSQLLYPTLISLLKELKKAGSFKISTPFFPGLINKIHLKKLETHYPFEANSKHFPATFELIYGHAFGSQKKEENITRISIEQIKRKK